ncbi:MAG: porin [Burkholderiaceae bacterium]
MKNLLVLSALALGSTAALAQTATVPNSVTLYGIIDVGVQRVTGYAKGTDTALISGIMEGTRFGLRASEDLGGGWRALFTMENRTEANNGTLGNRPPSGSQLPDRLSDARLLGLPCPPLPAACPLQAAVSQVAPSIGAGVGVNVANAFWDRQIYVGLVTPFGAVLAGRQYTPGYEINATFDIMNTQSSLQAGQVAALPSSIDIRLSNALQYRIVTGGLTASAMYAFGGVAGNNSASRFAGAMATYKLGSLLVGAGYNRRNNDLGETSLTSTVVGASYDIGPGKVSALVARYKDDNPLGSTRTTISTNLTPALGGAGAVLVANAFNNGLKQDGQLVHIGYKHITGPNTFYVAYSAANDKRPANADVASYGVAYTYALSKRTDLNAVLTHFDNKNLAQAAPGQAGFLGGVTSAAGVDSNSVAFGIRHRF